jgi:hypothetical protein
MKEYPNVQNIQLLEIFGMQILQLNLSNVG